MVLHSQNTKMLLFFVHFKAKLLLLKLVPYRLVIKKLIKENIESEKRKPMVILSKFPSKRIESKIAREAASKTQNTSKTQNISKTFLKHV